MFTVEEADKTWIATYESKQYIGAQVEHATIIADEGVEIVLMAWDDSARNFLANERRIATAQEAFAAFYRQLFT